MSGVYSKPKLLRENDYLWRESAPNFVNLFRTMFENKMCTDVIVKVEYGRRSKEIECHAVVLSAHSPVLSAMLSPERIGDNQEYLTLIDDDPDAFTLFIELMYRDWTEDNFKNYDTPEGLTPKLAVNVLSLAYKYLARHIIRQAEHLIHCILSKRNAEDTVKLYVKLKDLPICHRGQIARKTLRTVENCLLTDGENIFSSDAILKLRRTELVGLIGTIFLQCNEKTILSACLRWGRKQCKRQRLVATGQNIRFVLGDAIKLIRFPLLDDLTIENEVIPANILTEEETANLFAYLETNMGNPIDGRLSSSEIRICRAYVDEVSKDLADFSSPHGFEMIFSKNVKLNGVGFFVGNDPSKTYNIKVELLVDNNTFVLSNDSVSTADNHVFTEAFTEFTLDVHAAEEQNNVFVDFSPEVEISANIPVLLKFTIMGGDTFVTKELVDEIATEFNYLGNGGVKVTFKSSPGIKNGLKQVPSIWFSAIDGQ